MRTCYVEKNLQRLMREGTQSYRVELCEHSCSRGHESLACRLLKRRKIGAMSRLRVGHDQAPVAIPGQAGISRQRNEARNRA